ncbi:ABC transporter substrate-binding protein [Crenobacter sp. SG2303]|uniref:ABC transporter substrate-binding protein n=1 Tax=Crenobacter oryzisoli TaxID=3056844 RepID=A0ABT7XV18_9NEIS|nr:ABC transporter substrate-binding protein [Crenobacter sp. SG2303]MDN0077642.1 ABC transporter substrate-binding protein [Crenobacter sp. SG2303]
MKRVAVTLSVAVTGLLIFPTFVTAADLTVVSFGGANKEAQNKAYYLPFKAATGINVVGGDYNGEMAKVKAMVDTRRVSWDVLDVESPELARGCDEGLFEKLDYSRIVNRGELLPGAAQQCGVGAYIWSTVLAYNADKLKVAPSSWGDFWNVQKFPGKRGLRKGAKYTLEIALMADGVAPKDVYKVLATPTGVNRAFKKLDQLKPYIQWWEAGAQPPQYLVAGDVVMSSAYNGRIDSAQKDDKHLRIVWNGGMYDFDYWAIPKGTPNKEAAYRFLSFVSRAEPQSHYVQGISYGVSNKKATGLIEAHTLANLPTAPQNLKNAVAVDTGFWTDYGESLEQRFNAWASK